MEYIVNVKGSAARGGEISVVDKSNGCGIESYGWFDNHRKILIAGQGGPCNYTFLPRVWEEYIALAHKIADDLNSGKLVLLSEETTP